MMGTAETPNLEITAEETPAATPTKIDWVSLIPAALVFGGLLLVFWPLVQYLELIWFGDDTYYAHGVVVPICAGLIVWDRWEQIKTIPLRGSNLALIPLAGVLYVSWFASRTDMRFFQAVLLMLAIATAIAFIAGWKMLKAVAIPVAYLGFGLPILDRFVLDYTAPVQLISTDVSYQLLSLAGQTPYRSDPSTILLNNFTLDVGVPCSGIKLLMAVAAIAFFFVLIAHLKWWANLLLVASILPIAVLVNALRISLIGMVGNAYGHDAGHAFHDYSGYIGLAVCFAILYGLTRSLGWK